MAHRLCAQDAHSFVMWLCDSSHLQTELFFQSWNLGLPTWITFWSMRQLTSVIKQTAHPFHCSQNSCDHVNR